MDLIAKWKEQEDEYYEAPDYVKWSDGSLATGEDYLKHIEDSQCWMEDEVYGRHLRVCPSVIAHLTFDTYGGVWSVKGHGIEPKGLDLNDPNASDSQINCALNSGVWTYRVIIHRN